MYQSRDQFKKGADSVAIYHLYLANVKNEIYSLGLNALVNQISAIYSSNYLKKELERGYKIGLTNKVEGDSITAKTIRYATGLKIYKTASFQQSIENLAKTASSTECKKPAQQYADILSKSELLIKQGKYIDAKVHILKGLEISKQNPACYINSNTAITLLTSILPPSQYLELQNKALLYAEKENFDSAFLYHHLAQEHFQANKLAKYGLSQLSDFEFFTTSPNTDLPIFGIEHYLKTGRLDTALAISQRLPNKGYSKNYWIYVSEKLGEALARRDYKIKPRPDPDAALKTYTSNDRRYKELVKGYQKAWNEMGS